MRTLAFIVIICLLALSCKKDDDDVALIGTYSLSQQMKVGQVRMYTSTGEVTNGTVIKNFLKKGIKDMEDHTIDYSDYFHLARFTIPLTLDEDEHCEVKFYNDTQATINCRLLSVFTDGDFEAEVIKQGSLAILTGSIGNENSAKPSDINGYFNGSNNLDKVVYFIMEPTSSGAFFNRGRINIPLVVKNGKVAIPVLIFLYWHNNAPHQVTFGYQQHWNLANEAYLKNLSVHDTVVVQEGQIILQKQ